MKSLNAIGLLLFAPITIIFMTSCYRIEKQLTNKMTLYNLSDATSLQVSFQNSTANYTQIETQTSDGILVKGMIMLAGKSPEKNDLYYPHKDYQEMFDDMKELDEADSLSLKNKYYSGKTLPEIFGYSPDYKVAPKGFATLQVGENVVIDIAFYHLDYKLYFGSGMGIDNNGNIYKVYLVTEEL